MDLVLVLEKLLVKVRKDGTRLVNRELTELSGIAGLDTTDIRRQVFTLFYRNTGGDNPGIRFVAVDNFGVERTLDIPFSIEDKDITNIVKNKEPYVD